MRGRIASLGLGITVFVFAVAACDDPPPQAATRPSRSPSSAAAPASGAAAEPGKPATPTGPDPSLQNLDIPEKLKLVDWNEKDDLDRDLRDGRDPFQIYIEDLQPRPLRCEALADNPCRGPLCVDEVAAMGLIAIITGTAVHKAMLSDVHTVGHIVRAGDIVGKTPFRITRITRNEVVFKPLQPPAAGQPPVQEVVKRLLGEQELQELLP